jgi:hypothetical protein
MRWDGMETPCMIEGTGGIRFSNEFTIRTQIKADIIGGIQAIFSKRHPLSVGNRPGILITLRGSLIECMTFQNNGESWITARSIRNVIEVGQKYEILVFRIGGKMRIFINGADRTHRRYGTCSPGDINSDMDVLIGGQLYDAPPLSEVFNGVIYWVELYEMARMSRASRIRYPQNPFAFPLSQLKQKKEELKLPAGLGERA